MIVMVIELKRMYYKLEVYVMMIICTQIGNNAKYKNSLRLIKNTKFLQRN